MHYCLRRQTGSLTNMIVSDIVYTEDDYEKKFGRKFDPEDKSERKF